LNLIIPSNNEQILPIPNGNGTQIKQFQEYFRVSCKIFDIKKEYK